MTVPNGSRLSTKSNMPYDRTGESDVQIWRVVEAKITEMLLLGDVFVVRDDAPDELDPALVARQFLNVFDIGKTKVMRKAYSDCKGISKAYKTANKKTVGDASIRPRRYQKPLNYDRISIINNVGIYKEPIVGFYRRFPGKFSNENFDDYLRELFPDVTQITTMNKRRAYLQYMVKENFVKRTEIYSGAPRKSFTYEFIRAPYDATPAAQAEFDPAYARQSMTRELETMRQGA